MSSAVIQRLDKISTANGLEIAKGNISGHSSIEKFGTNADVDTATTPEDVWSQGGVKTFSATANIDGISSSDNGDTQDITVIGLADGYGEVTQTFALTGQTTKVIPIPLIRVYRALNANGTNFVGDIYIYINGATVVAGVATVQTEVRLKVDAGDNQSLTAIYTIPAGKTGYLNFYHVSMAKLTPATALVCALRIRPFGGVFLTKDIGAAATTGNNTYIREYKTPLKIDEKSDVKLVIDAVTSNDTAVAGAFDIVLVDN